MKYTLKQQRAIHLLKNKKKRFYLFDGGARSGKTHVIVSFIIHRAIKYAGTRHLVGRFRFNHAKLSVWKLTIIPLLREILPIRSYHINRSDYIVQLANGSELWLAGFDDPERVEKIMGTEFASIFINEASQIAYDTYQSLKSRLNDFSKIYEKFILDTNPRSPSHWLHRLFIEDKNPDDLTPLKKKRLHARLFFKPEDNKTNLKDGYIEETLDSLTGVKLKRLRFGQWVDSGDKVVYRFKRNINDSDKHIHYSTDCDLWCTWDFGIDPSDTAIIWIQIRPVPVTPRNKKGLLIEIIDYYINRNQDSDHYADVVLAKNYKEVTYCGDPAGKIRGQNLKSWFSDLRQRGIYIQSKSGYTVADKIANANKYIPYLRINETQCPPIIEMLENWDYPIDSEGKVPEGIKPKHNKYSHPGSALYEFFLNRFPPRKGGKLTTF